MSFKRRPHILYIQSSSNVKVQSGRKVNVWEVIEGRVGLDIEFNILGVSHGQQQLFSLARAMLNERKVVLLDETTSIVDS